MEDKFYQISPYGVPQMVDMLTGEITDITLQKQAYTVELSFLVVDLIRKGKTFRQALLALSIPPSVGYYWRERYPDFDKKVQQAVQDRADEFHTKMVEIADALEENRDEYVLKNERARFDMYAKLAAYDRPQTFGSKTTVEGNASKPIQIVISTGIDRGQQPDNTALAKEQEHILAQVVEETAQLALPLGKGEDGD